MFTLTQGELAVFKKLSTPQKIQDFLSSLPINWEKEGETCYSPRRVLQHKKAHCMEGALFAAAALWFHGQEPLIMDLKVWKGDDDHVVALFKQNGYWGAVSKTNHATVRYRDPIFKTPRELAASYFHEYFLNSNGEKILRSYSRPMNLKRFGASWVTTEEDLFFIAEKLDDSKHVDLVSKNNRRLIRKAEPVERRAGEIIEWKKTDPRT